MGANHLMQTPCTILRREVTGEDEFGNPTKDPTDADTLCALQQVSASESDEHGEISDTTWHLFLPIGTVIDTGDAVTVAGRQYEVIGDPWEAREGTSAMWHIEARLQRTATSGDDR